MHKIFCIATIFLAVLASTAQAGWRYVRQASGLYCWTDGQTTDGRLYESYQNNGQTCYRQAEQQPAAVTPPAYGPNWKVEGIRAYLALKDNQDYLDFIADAFPQRQQASGGTSYSHSGVQTIQQGYSPYAAQGSLVMGLGTYQTGYPPFDPQAANRDLLRSADQYLGVAERVHRMVADSNQQSAEAQKMTALLGGLAQLAVAAQPPQTTTTTWQSEAGQAGHSDARILRAGATGRVLAEASIQTSCTGCHSAEKHAGDLDLTALGTLAPEAVRDLWTRPDGVIDRLTTADPGKQMPPPGKGLLTPEQKLAIIGKR
jgi:hypothetical protein